MTDLLHPDRISVAAPSTLTPICIGLTDAARLLSVSSRHLHSLTKRGEVPSARIGGRVVYRVSALEQWLQWQEVKASN